MVDPGFPVGGGADPLGGANLQHVHFSAKTYAKMKEIDPVGGVARRGAPWIRQCLEQNLLDSLRFLGLVHKIVVQWVQEVFVHFG